jgi:hypothetical protein
MSQGWRKSFLRQLLSPMSLRPNPPFQGAVGKLRSPIRSVLRAPAAPELIRWATHEKHQ